MILKRSEMEGLWDGRSFFWATGIEDTFITAAHPKTGRTLDEYELTDHYARWEEDLQLASQLGVQAMRYGIPWHRIQPSTSQWEWDWSDRALDRLLDLGIQPIVDLIHYGLPSWMEGAYTHPDFPKYAAEYAARVAERFRGRIFAYTPLNEPRITAWYCGKLGWWPPGLKGWRGFLRVMLQVCRGMCAMHQALKRVDAENVSVWVDATDYYETEDPSLLEAVEQRQELVFLALDLVTGHVAPGHSLYLWLLRNGVTEDDLESFHLTPVDPAIIGINLYPMFSQKNLVRGSRGLRIRMPYADGQIVEDLAELYWDRYRVPLFISETASEGSVRKRQRWLEDSVAAVMRVRDRGIPLVGYTWWPMYALVAWACRQGLHSTDYYLKQMGLWDLDKNLDRQPTALVAQFRHYASESLIFQQQEETHERMIHVS